MAFIEETITMQVLVVIFRITITMIEITDKFRIRVIIREFQQEVELLLMRLAIAQEMMRTSQILKICL